MYKSILVRKINKSNLEPLKGLDLTAVVILSEALDKESLELIHEVLGEVNIEVIFKCFEGKNLQEKYPESIPLEVEENEVNEKDYHPVSPVNDDVRNYLLDEIEKISAFKIQTVWLDQLHFPTKWWSKDPKILDTDYSQYALNKFEEYIGEPIEGSNLEEKFLHIDGSYYHEWLKFKAEFIQDFLRKAKHILGKNDINTGLFIVPWEEIDYRAGIKRLLGQDHSSLIDIADRISLKMPYYSMEKDNEWVKAKLEYFWHLGKKFISFVDVNHNQKDFEEIIPVLLQTPSEGFIIDSLEDLKDSQLDFLK